MTKTPVAVRQVTPQLLDQGIVKSNSFSVPHGTKPLVRGAQGDGGTLLRGMHLPQNIDENDVPEIASPTVAPSKGQIASLDAHDAAMLKELMSGIQPLK